MNAIWKTPLNLVGSTVTQVTSSAPAPLHVGIDANGVPCVWYWAPDSENTFVTDIEVIGTGIKTDRILPGYLGTFVWRTLVLHAFHSVGAWE